MKLRSIAAGVVLSIAGAVSASAAIINVDGQAGPWSIGANPALTYGIGDNLGPSSLAVVAGSSLTITFLDGFTNAFGNDPGLNVGPTGYPGFDASNNPGSTGEVFPSFYANSATYPIFLNALIGAFANAGGAVVGTPFAPFPVDSAIAYVVTVPAGATQLLFGINDDTFGDNTGALRVQVDATPLPAALPLFASGLAAMGVIGWRRRTRGARATT
jgi:hypothetical protein